MRKTYGRPTLEFRTTEILDNILPVRGVVVTAQVGLQFSRENLQGRTLPNTVGSDQTQHLSRSRHRKAMQLEAIRAITVGDLALEVRGKVDDGDGVEGAFLRANTTTDAEGLGDESEARLRSNLDAELAASDDGTRLLAFLTTFSRATLRVNKVSIVDGGVFGGVRGASTNLVAVDDSDTRSLRVSTCCISSKKIHKISFPCTYRVSLSDMIATEKDTKSIQVERLWGFRGFL